MNPLTRHVMPAAALALGILLVPAASGQQLSAHMSHVLQQQGQIEDYIKSPQTVDIGPDSYNDRLAILQHCETVMETNWAIVEGQFGYNDALRKMTNSLAAAIGFLQQARRSQEGMTELRNWHSQFINDSSGSGTILNCVLGKAIELAGNTSQPANAANTESHTVIYVDEFPPEVKQQAEEALRQARAICPECALPDLPWAQKADKPAAAPEAKPKPPLPKIKTMASLGSGCVQPAIRNVRVNTTDNVSQTADIVLKNSCKKAQIVKIDVRGWGLHSWPALLNLGTWASTANADVPEGLPFAPVMSLAEGADYMVPAQGEHEITNWPVPQLPGEEGELKVWLASCDAYSSQGFQQVVFRPTSHFSEDVRAVCGPSRKKI